ncbi:Hypothetical predicted protein [Lynx pardinus]|uniref:Uncharacterized protein n=1 Tax=Lynx pardinus TaxID=191816 RepID=A0A485NNZ8_LYNPA|nr:Hypothetical predicted protein [Lynx pardinus]
MLGSGGGGVQRPAVLPTWAPRKRAGVPRVVQRHYWTGEGQREALTNPRTPGPWLAM